MHTTPPTPPHPLCTAFSPGRLSVSWSSLSCLFFLLFVFRLQGRPAASKIQSDLRHGCCRALLPQLFGRPFSPNSILPGRSSPVRPCLTACGRPVGLPTTLTQCQRQLRSLSFHCYLYVTVIKGLLLRQRSGVSQLDSPLVFPRQRPFNVRPFLCCCPSRLSW